MPKSLTCICYKFHGCWKWFLTNVSQSKNFPSHLLLLIGVNTANQNFNKTTSILWFLVPIFSFSFFHFCFGNWFVLTVSFVNCDGWPRVSLHNLWTVPNENPYKMSDISSQLECLQQEAGVVVDSVLAYWNWSLYCHQSYAKLLLFVVLFFCFFQTIGSHDTVLLKSYSGFFVCLLPLL